MAGNQIGGVALIGAGLYPKLGNTPLSYIQGYEHN
jgi:hypothetical protein